SGSVMGELVFATATDLVARLQRGEVSSAELLEAFLQRIDQVNGPVNAMVTIDFDAARERARTADEERVRGEAGGPLHGLPITIKDCSETAGIRTTAGAPFLADHVPERDADAVARLRNAGANVFAKTNVPFLTADGQAYNDIVGQTNNPWDLSRAPGGSSGGAAAALAAGMTPLDLGSDIAGSGPIPASLWPRLAPWPSYGL